MANEFTQVKDQNEVIHPVCDSTARSSISGILDGTTIDSFADVESALSGKEDTLTFDDAPTASSTNPVKSGGVYSGIVANTQLITDTVGWSGKNLFDYGSYKGTTVENSGITFAIDNEGKVKCTGTASASPTTMQVNYTLPAGDYILNGCPANGSDSSYRLDIPSLSKNDYGNGVEFTLDTETQIAVRIRFANGYACPSGGIEFKPMIRYADIIDSTYEPYHASVDETKANASALGTVENGTTASKAYAVGEHFYKDGYFCTVTQAIASGGTLTQGTNYKVGDIGSSTMGILVDANTTITNLDNIPVGCGYVKIDASVSMTGSAFAGEYFCIGDPNGNRSLFMYRYATTTLYVCHRTSGTWTSWTSLTFS